MTCWVTDLRCLPLGSAQRISLVFSEGLGGRAIHLLSGAAAALLHGLHPASHHACTPGEAGPSVSTSDPRQIPAQTVHTLRTTEAAGGSHAGLSGKERRPAKSGPPVWKPAMGGVSAERRRSGIGDRSASGVLFL